MADNVPEGFDDEVISQLERGIGSNWQDVFKQKWGDNWAELCAAEMTTELGTGWPDESVDSKIATLTEMVGDESGGSGADAVPDPGQDEWLRTFDGTNTFEEWLARIGVPTEEITALEGSALEGSDKPTEDTVPDPNHNEWMQTFDGTNTFEEWLIRIGVPTEEAQSLPQS